MDTTDSKISFNENDICDHCINFFENIFPFINGVNEADAKINTLSKRVKGQ